jgi:hypothetical protein
MVGVDTRKWKAAQTAHLMALMLRRLRCHGRFLKRSTVIQAKARNSSKPFPVVAARAGDFLFLKRFEVWQCKSSFST